MRPPPRALRPLSRRGLLVVALVALVALPSCLTPPPLLRAVRVGHHPSFDRLVLELSGDVVPEVTVTRTTAPVREDGSGRVVELAGSAAVVVRLHPAFGYDPATWEPTYTGPQTLPVGGSDGAGATDATFVSDFEGQVVWAVGTHDLPAALGTRVATLRDPTRVVIDVPR